MTKKVDTEIVSVFANVTDFSKIPDNSTLQILELIPCPLKIGVFYVNLSDGNKYLIIIEGDIISSSSVEGIMDLNNKIHEYIIK